VYKALKCT